ncbi:MAG: hypothetical protein LBR47_04215, partial [Spirochaetaceae bacterium]|nr:hypothetical protein [Spirochaetaceae bacterium]
MKIFHFFIRICIFLGISLILVSCDSVFGTSLASGLKRNNIYKNLSTAELVNQAENARGEERKQLLKELGKKSDGELKGLSSGEKESILKLATDTTFSVEAITNTINTITNTGVDFSSIDPVDFMDRIFESIPTDVDTTALQLLLSDTSVVNTVSQDTIILSTLALLAQSAKNDPAITS